MIKIGSLRTSFSMFGSYARTSESYCISPEIEYMLSIRQKWARGKYISSLPFEFSIL